jgi:dihydrofolate reductase
MKVVLIAAVGRHGEIGRGNDLLWRTREDLLHLKNTTMGHPVVMGRKTWDSLPERFRPLPGRRNLVVSRNAAFEASGAEAVTSLDAALAACADAPRVFVVGGAQLYALALPRADELVLTEVDAAFDDADAFFPAWDRDHFEEQSRVPHTDADGRPFAFVHYTRHPGA